MKHLKQLTYSCLLLLLLNSCRKQEFILPPEGEQVPNTDVIKLSLKEALEKSPAKLFYQAWQRSTMDSRLKAINNPKSGFTILAPSDAAMENAGFNAQKIQSMEVKDLDELMLFYTLQGRISNEDMESKPDNYFATSMLQNPAFRVKQTQSSGQFFSAIVPYNYQQCLQVKAGKTYVNGKLAGGGKYTAAKDGYLWLLDQMVTKPEKTILEVLQEDGRFALLLAILQYTDEQYAQTVEEGGIWNNYRKGFVERYNWATPPENPWDPERLLTRTTAILPRDEVFRNAGFNSVEDLKEFNIKRGLPHIEQDQYGNNIIVGNFATDSLLGYHLDLGLIVNRYNVKVGRTVPFNFGFNTNDMTNAVMSDCLIGVVMPEGLSEQSDYRSFYMPFDFSRDASGRVQLKVKDVPDATLATITEADIPTLMGPIHVVDHFLTPKGFKINQK